MSVDQKMTADELEVLLRPWTVAHGGVIHVFQTKTEADAFCRVVNGGSPLRTGQCVMSEGDITWVANQLRDLPDGVLVAMVQSLPDCRECLGAGGSGNMTDFLTWQTEECRPCMGTGKVLPLPVEPHR